MKTVHPLAGPRGFSWEKRVEYDLDADTPVRITMKEIFIYFITRKNLWLDN